MNVTKRILLLLITITLTLGLSAQTVKDANLKYNEGAQLLSTDPAGALKAFEECVKMCDAIGDEASDTRDRAVAQIPGLHYKQAMGTYKAKKFVDAIAKFQATAKVAEKYGDDNIKKKSLSKVPVIYLQIANSYSKKKDFDNAIANYDKAIEIKPEYAKAYFYKGLAQKKKGDTEGMIESFTLTIEKDTKGKTAAKAKKIIGTHYLKAGEKARKAKKFADAVENYTKSLEYSKPSAQVYGLMAISYKELKEFDKGIEAAIKAVELEKGGVEKVAKHNFTLAEIYRLKGDVAKACETYKLAEVGSVAANAKYQREQVLKCK
ncbi:MAG: tetratricopeptide repeat protein [Bacteroidales bacterium]|jgi:tetratricopeptide (TPR) repeat protein|nr:tetratricopeptide repeat protein [Bacteroidales bacterium]